MIARLTLALMTAAALAGCASNQYLVGEASVPSVSQAETEINTPTAGASNLAVASLTAQTGPVSGANVYNSDNHGIISRTGLNSDPNNPSGAPGSPRAWNSF